MEQKVSLFLRARKLPKLDKLSESDPFVVIYTKENLSADWTEFHRTITLNNQKDPQWPDPVVMDYQFETLQPLRFEIYDRDSKKEDLAKQQLIGYFETSLGKVLSSKRNMIESGLMNKKDKPVKKAVFSVVGETVKNSQDVLSFQFSATKLAKKNMMGKSDPFYKIALSMKGVSPVVVFESEHIVKTLDPKWQPQEIPLQRICNGELDRDLTIEVYDWEKNGKHKLIGLFAATTQDLLDKDSFNLINLKSKKQKKSCGTFNIDSIKVRKQPSFLQYIENGCEINLSIGIDFSSKNGDLHNLSEDTSNQYQQAIVSVGQVLQDYDSDQKIGAFGFGASFDGSFDDNCFPLSLDGEQEELEGVDGILKAYQDNFDKIKPSESCNLATIVKKFISDVDPVTQDKQFYNILLLLTTGQLDDFDDTVKAIVEASDKPVSIVIVGLGEGDFAQMDHLDGDNSLHLTDVDGNTSTRDIVQFVPYLKTVSDGPAALAKETLGELPQQLERYMWANDILPMKQEEE